MWVKRIADDSLPGLVNMEQITNIFVQRYSDFHYAVNADTVDGCITLTLAEYKSTLKGVAMAQATQCIERLAKLFGAAELG